MAQKRVVIPKTDYEKRTVNNGERYVFTYTHGTVISERINISDIQSKMAGWLSKKGNNYDVETVIFYPERNETEVTVKVKDLKYNAASFQTIFITALFLIGITAFLLQVSLSKVEQIVEEVPGEAITRFSTTTLIIAGVIAALTGHFLLRSWSK